MTWLNVAALLLFALLNLLAERVGRWPLGWSQPLVRTLCRLLLYGNLLRYLVVYPFFDLQIRIPAEFSTVAYFAVPMILLAGRRTLTGWAAYSGLMAGFFYYLAMAAAGGAIYGDNALADTVISLFCHGTLYFVGRVTIATVRCQSAHMDRLLLCGVGYVALRAALLRPLVVGRGRMLIYILLDAIPVQMAFPRWAWELALPVYYALLLAFVLVTISGFCRRSEQQYRRYTALRAAACS